MAGQYSGGSAGGGTEFYTNLPPKDQDALEKKFPHIKNAYNALLLATNTQLKIEE